MPSKDSPRGYSRNKMLKSDHLMLAPITSEDSPTLWKWINNREQVLFSAQYKPVHKSQHEEWFASIQRRSDVVIFGIRLQETNKLIGSCQLHSIHPVHRTAELQIRIGEVSERGKGYGTEATNQLLLFAFKDLNLHRVYLHVLGDNAAALRMYEKIGFKREGALRQAAYIDGKYLDVVVMGILREEYAR